MQSGRQKNDRKPYRPKQRQRRAAIVVSNAPIHNSTVSVRFREDAAPVRFVRSCEQTLAAFVAEHRPERLLEVGAEIGVVGLGAIQNGWAQSVTWLTRDVVAANVLQATVDTASSESAHVVLAEGPSSLTSGQYDVIVVHQQRSRALTELYILQAETFLRSGGAMLVAGDIQDGIRTTCTFMRTLFDDVTHREGGKSSRVIVARKPRERCLDADELEGRSYGGFQIEGTRVELVTAPGVFSADDLDPASRLLLETVVLPHKGRVLDLGCGPGALGLYAALRAPGTSVTMIDSDIAAVNCAEEGVHRNGLENVRVLAGDGIDVVRKERFDVVMTNPPMHRAGRRETGLVERFVREAAHVIGRKGRLWLVTAPTVPVMRVLKELFTEITITDDEDGKFRVYDAIRRPPRQADRKQLEEREATVNTRDAWYDFDEEW